MKKSILISLLIIALIGGLFVLTGCSKGETYTLTETYYSKDYQTSFTVGDGDEVDFDEEEPDFTRIENAEENYAIDLNSYIDTKEGYESTKNTAKDVNEAYEEVKFGEYDGYIGKTSDGEVFGIILLEATKDDEYHTLTFNVSVNDPTIGGTDGEKLYKSEKVQNILNSVEYKGEK